jgi:uncharacterized membrane protein
MTILIIGLFLFGGSHLFSILLPPVRNRLSAWLGEGRYKGMYSLLSVIGIVLMGWGYVLTRDNGEMLYAPSYGTRHMTIILVLLGFILMSAAYGKSYIRKYFQNPFSIGICFWSVGHLIANGKTPVVLIYLTLILIAALDIFRNMARCNGPTFEPNVRSDMVAIGAGLAIYGLLLLVFHPYILGIRVVG